MSEEFFLDGCVSRVLVKEKDNHARTPLLTINVCNLL